MKITFLGTSHGVPASDRFCSCVMIESGDAVYFIDGGAPVIDLLLRHGRHPDDIRALFNTHIHGDHTAGIYHLADLIDWYYKKAAMDFYIADQVYIDALKTMITAGNARSSLSPDRLRFHEAHTGVVYEDENISVEYIPTKHMSEPRHSYAILVREGEKAVLFSGDLSQHLEKCDVPSVLREMPTDLFVCEMAHFNTTHLLPHLEGAKCKKIAVTHVFPLSKYGDLENARENFPCPVITPADGESLEI